jgi:hypothetical protein
MVIRKHLLRKFSSPYILWLCLLLLTEYIYHILIFMISLLQGLHVPIRPLRLRLIGCITPIKLETRHQWCFLSYKIVLSWHRLMLLLSLNLLRFNPLFRYWFWLSYDKYIFISLSRQHRIQKLLKVIMIIRQSLRLILNQFLNGFIRYYRLFFSFLSLLLLLPLLSQDKLFILLWKHLIYNIPPLLKLFQSVTHL